MNKFNIFISLALPWILCACPPFDSASLNLTTSASPSPSVSSSSSSLAASVPSGARAAKIIFKQSSSTGSFDAAPTNGTAVTPGSGHKVSRVFNADGSLLASSTSASTWPKWLTSFEIGISGSSNTSATNADCARFAATDEDTATTCTFGSSTGVKCGASAGLFRVSEYDCTRGTIDTGTGGSSDGVYLRAVFSRDTSYLAAHENILVVLEYAASVVNAAPADPSVCFTNGSFDPTNTSCSDMSWQIYIKHNTSETVQPYLMLVPPAFAFVNATANRGGSGVSTKQFIVPLAGDADLTVLQISRIKALSYSNYTSTCNPSGSSSANNSALCMGMVFYSMTFFRI